MKKNYSRSINVNGALWTLFLAGLLTVSSCTFVVLKPVDYSWLVESKLTTDANGFIKGDPRSFQCNMKELFLEEEGPTGLTKLEKRTINIIRDRDGYYFMTSHGFKHVYVFESSEAELSLKKKVLITESGMETPYFNYRANGIELNANGKELLLNKSGIIVGGSK